MECHPWLEVSDRRNKHKRDFVLQVRCRELDIFKFFEKLLGNFLDLFGKFWKFFRSIFWEEFFGRNVFEDFFGRIFWEEFLGKKFGGGFFWRIFLGGFFGEDFLGGFFWEEFFGRNYLVDFYKELMFLSRFWANFV